MKNKKLLSIVIPFYDAEEYFEECLLSIKNSIDQKNASLIEVLLINDVSPDNSLEIAEKFVNSRPDIFTIITHEVNKGSGGARNTGVENATGDFITFLDSDDKYEKLALSILIKNVKAMKTNEMLVFGFTARKEGKKIWAYIPKKTETISSNEALQLFSEDKITSAVWNKVFPVKMFENVIFAEHKYHEDLEFTPVAMEYVAKLKFMSVSLVEYRLDGVSVTRQQTKIKHIEDMDSVLGVLNEKIKDDTYFSNIYFNRWGYQLKAWGCSKELFHLAIKRISDFMKKTDRLNFTSTQANYFFDNLRDECIRLSSLDEVSKILNQVYRIDNKKQTNKKPLISIVVPVFEGELFINKFLDQYANQKFTDYELILVDDKSNDKSFEIIESYLSRFENITQISNLRNFGPGTTRNIGLSHARGEYVIFQDVDDLPESDSLTIFSDEIKKHNKPDMILHPFKVLKADYSYYWSSKKIEELPNVTYNGLEILELLSKSIVNPAPWNKMFKRSVWTNNKIQFTPWIHHQDLSTIPYASYKCDKIILLKNHLYNYYTNENGITQTVTDKHVYSAFTSPIHLYDRFKLDSTFNNDIKEKLFELFFENINYNFKLRNSSFSKAQVAKFTEFYDLFLKHIQVDLAYLTFSKKATELTYNILDRAQELGVEPEISIDLTPASFIEFFNINKQIEFQIELLNWGANQKLQDVHRLEKELVNIPKVDPRVLKNAENQIKSLEYKLNTTPEVKPIILHDNERSREIQQHYNNVYEKMPMWWKKMGALVRKIKN